MLTYNFSSVNAAEACVDVWVERLEPVAECRAREARGGSRGGAFQDVMFVVEEIGGVTGIKGKAFEAREWGEWGAGPFPAVAEHFDGAEGARDIFI